MMQTKEESELALEAAAVSSSDLKLQVHVRAPLREGLYYTPS